MLVRLMRKIDHKDTIVVCNPGSMERKPYKQPKSGLGPRRANYGGDMVDRAEPAAVICMEGNLQTYKKAMANVTGMPEFSSRVFLGHTIMSKDTVEPLLSRAYSCILGIDSDSSENQYQNRELIEKTVDYLQDGRLTAVFIFAYNNLVNLVDKWRNDGLVDYITMYPTTSNGKRGYLLWICKAGNLAVRETLYKYAKNHEGHMPNNDECRCAFYCNGGDQQLRRRKPDPNDIETVFKKRRFKWTDLPKAVAGQQVWCTTSDMGGIINVSVKLDPNGRLEPLTQARANAIKKSVTKGMLSPEDSLARESLLLRGLSGVFLDEVTSELRSAVWDAATGKNIQNILEKLEASGISKNPEMVRLLDQYIGKVVGASSPSGQ